VIYLTQFEKTGVSKANKLLSVAVEYQNKRESFPKRCSGIRPFLLVISALNDAFSRRDFCGSKSDGEIIVKSKYGYEEEFRHRIQDILRAESKVIFVNSRCGTMLQAGKSRVRFPMR
jgi:hypothetical protein